MTGVADPRDVAAHQVEVAALERADVDDHVDLTGTVPHGAPRLEGLHVGRGGSEGEADDRGHRDVGIAQADRGPAHPGGVDADRGEVMLRGFIAELVDVCGGGVGLEQCVVDIARQVQRHVGGLAVVLDAVGAALHQRAHLGRALGRTALEAARAWVAGVGHGGALAQRSQHLPGDGLDEVVALVGGRGHRSFP